MKRLSNRGFTVLEILSALFLFTMLSAMVTSLLISTRDVVRSTGQNDLAAAITQGVFERLLRVPPQELPRLGSKPSTLLPPETRALKDPSLSLDIARWPDHPGLLHLKVELTWTGPKGRRRTITREGLRRDGTPQ